MNSQLGRQFLFTMLTLLCSLLIIVVGAEAYVRIFVDNGMQFDLEMWKYARDVKRVSHDPLIGHEHRPDRDALLMGVDVKTNSRGLRDDREYPYEHPPGVLRLVMLGDSLTEGWGVPLEDTFPKRIERMYAAQGVKAEVINTGVGNYDTIQEVEAFLTEFYKYSPDIVVLNFFVNDAEPVPHDVPPGPIARLCYSCVYFTGRIDELLRQYGSRGDWTDYYLGLFGDGSTKGWLDAKAYLQKLADYCKAHGIKLLVVSLPELHDVNNYRFQPITDLLHQAANEDHVAFLDVLPYFKGQDSSKLWVSPGDVHPNAYADQFIAQGEFDALQRLSSDVQ